MSVTIGKVLEPIRQDKHVLVHCFGPRRDALVVRWKPLFFDDQEVETFVVAPGSDDVYKAADAAADKETREVDYVIRCAEFGLAVVAAPPLPDARRMRTASGSRTRPSRSSTDTKHARVSGPELYKNDM